MKKLFVIIVVAAVVAYFISPLSPIPFLAKYGGACVILVPAFAILSLILAVRESAPIPCVSPSGSTIQWTKREYENICVSHYVYLTLPDDPDHFCKVRDHNLYQMGIGYQTNKSYTGVKINTP